MLGAFIDVRNTAAEMAFARTGEELSIYVPSAGFTTVSREVPAAEYQRAQAVTQAHVERWAGAVEGSPYRSSNIARAYRDAALQAEPMLRVSARTEASQSFNYARDRVLSGIQSDVLFKVWDSILDANRTCRICATAHGTVVRLQEEFPQGIPGGVHPNCLCSEQILPAWLIDDDELERLNAGTARAFIPQQQRPQLRLIRGGGAPRKGIPRPAPQKKKFSELTAAEQRARRSAAAKKAAETRRRNAILKAQEKAPQRKFSELTEVEKRARRSAAAKKAAATRRRRIAEKAAQAKEAKPTALSGIERLERPTKKTLLRQQKLVDALPQRLNKTDAEALVAQTKANVPTALAMRHPRLVAALGGRISVSAQSWRSQAVRDALADLDQLPSRLLQKVAHTGKVKFEGIFVGTERITDLDDMLGLRGVRVPGWTSGTWDIVGGAGDARRAVISVTGQTGSSSTALHEFGHTIGARLRIDGSRDLTTLHKKLYHRLDNYLRQDGPGKLAGKQELFAESVADYFKLGRARTVAKYSDEYVGWLEHKLGKRATAPKIAAAPKPVRTPKPTPRSVARIHKVADEQLAEATKDVARFAKDVERFRRGEVPKWLADRSPEQLVARAEENLAAAKQRVARLERAKAVRATETTVRDYDQAIELRVLDKQENNAIKGFTGNTSGTIRKMQSDPSFLRRNPDLKEYFEDGKAIERAIANNVQYEGRVWRGILVDEATLDTYLKRDVFDWGAKSTSTSIRESVAADFARVRAGEHSRGIIFNIRNGRGLAVEDLGKPGELEVIQSGTAKFRRVGEPFRRADGSWQIDLEQIR